MKHLKKLAAVLLALLMVMSLTTTAFAADSAFTISVSDGDTHTYEIYQIFTGDLSEGVLSNVKWGKNAKNNTEDATEGELVPESVLTELAAVSSSTSNKDKLNVILKYANLTTAISTVTKDTTYTADPGYYLIKDSTFAENTDDAYTTYIVQVVDNVTIERKAAKPTVDKQVHDEEADAETGHTNGWGETADHAINESFRFKLIATLPNDDDLNDYESYKLIFNDTMSNGVTFESIESVTVGGVTLTANDYTCTATANQTGGSWTLTIADLLEVNGINSLKNLTVEVIYNAHLNENAIIGNTDQNKNTVNLEYSNNPNAGGEGETGKTPDDTVYVFTYQIENIKVEPDASKQETAANATKPLKDAGFRLYSDEACTDQNEIKLVYDETLQAYRLAKTSETGVEMKSPEDGKFVIKGLDTGTYYIKETTTPAGYNTCPVMEIIISATHKENTAGGTQEAETTITINGKTPAEIKFVNTKGTTLPETGGIGTTIFYVLGSLMAVGAAVLLITKKRVSE